MDSAATPMYHYAYDGAGNRVAWTTPGGACSTDCTEYDAQDRLIRYGAVGSEVTFTYQPGGALASRTEGANTTTYTYGTLPNGTEALWRVDLPGGTNVSYQVDAFGRRTARLVNGAVTHRWVFGPPGEGVTSLRPLAQLSAAGAIEQVYLYGTSPLTPDVILSDLTESGGTWTGNAYRVIADQVGSVRRIVNAETGVTVYTTDYSPFGVVVAESGAFDQPFGFAGGMRDSLTGLTRFGARDYDPQVGRWTSKDPIRFDGGLNLYEYAAGAPQMYVDPTGRNPLWFWGAAIGGAIGGIGGAIYGWNQTGTIDGALSAAAYGGLKGAIIGALPFGPAIGAAGVFGLYEASESADECTGDAGLDDYVISVSANVLGVLVGKSLAAGASSIAKAVGVQVGWTIGPSTLPFRVTATRSIMNSTENAVTRGGQAAGSAASGRARDAYRDYFQ